MVNFHLSKTLEILLLIWGPPFGGEVRQELDRPLTTTYNFCPLGLRCPCGWCQELFGHSLPLGYVHSTQGCATAILADDHWGSWVHIGAVDDCLPQFLDIPGCNWLRVGQFCGKYLEMKSEYRNSGWTDKVHRDPKSNSTVWFIFPPRCGKLSA
jgi:hypothetical protein